MYNLLTCAGWAQQVGFINFGGDCFKSRLGIVILFFIIAIVNKWIGEEAGVSFNFLFALLFGIIPYFALVILFGSFKIAFGVGLIASMVGGFGAGTMFGGSE